MHTQANRINKDFNNSNVLRNSRKVMDQKVYEIFLVLGAVWVIVGLLIYQNPAIWPLGFIFLIIGLIGRFSKNTSKRLLSIHI